MRFRSGCSRKSFNSNYECIWIDDVALQVAANENIYTQGDVGDEFYIVKKYVSMLFFYFLIFSTRFRCRGQFEVHANGMKVGIHDDSGYFGEMALMYNVQRRNTVKAATDGLLWYVVSKRLSATITPNVIARRRNIRFHLTETIEF